MVDGTALLSPFRLPPGDVLSTKTLIERRKSMAEEIKVGCARPTGGFSGAEEG
jgi:hypothetical protein